MATAPINESEAVVILDRMFDELDETRLRELETTRQLLSSQQKGLQNEKERLIQKYGQGHTGLPGIEARLAYREQLLAALDAEIAVAKIKPNVPSPTAWQVQGQVFDASGKPAAGVTILLGDDKGQPLRELPQAGTDDQGYYALILEREQAAKVKDSTLFLQVYRTEARAPYVDTLALKATPGAVQSRDILLPASTVGVPPAPGSNG